MLGKQLRERYEIIRALGSGGFGKTYLARDRDLPGNPFCVVKQFQPQFHQPEALKQARKLFQREAEVLYQLGDFDQIPRLFAHFQQEGEFYVVQEYIEGSDLSRELQAGKRLSDFEVVLMLRDILSIIEFVHQQQVIHRDIKPSNLIRRSRDNKLVLIDFGAVKHVAVYNNIPGTVIGTPGYMAPEQARGKPQFSSDLYAVGILAIQGLTGILPHQLSESLQTGNLLWREYLQSPVHPALINIIDKMVCSDVRQRYQTATAILNDLSQLELTVYQPNSTVNLVVDTLPSHLRGQRTLAAIVFTDGVGFSARMSTDEEHTLDMIQRDLQLMRETCQQYEGEAIKSTGDGLLMYFVSAVNAVNCAIEIQTQIATNARQLSANDVLLHRIGIHLGDVYFQDGDVMGNGVNIAARLEGKAPPGGICLSGAVYEAIKPTLTLSVTPLGELNLKNISESISAYSLLPVSPPEGTLPPASQQVIPKPQLSREDYRYRQIIINKVKNFWIKGVLETSIHDRALIELGLESRLDLVERPWGMVWGNPDTDGELLPSGVKVSDKFKEMGEGRSLLILGEPGSGKTTTLLQLTRDLLAQAEIDYSHPIPVVFNLSSWMNEKQLIQDWLVCELNTKYQVSKKIAESWLEKGELLLLLDGLDEVSEKRRSACVTAINQFYQEHGTTELVVCSRIQDYQALQTRLNLQAAICLQPLSLEQIHQYFQEGGAELSVIQTALAEDTTLQELAKSPLMLSIMTLAYQGISADSLPHFKTIEQRRKHLFETYIQRMLTRYNTPLNYSKEQFIDWLSWLAKRLKEHSQTVFLIERIQPSWLEGFRQKAIYTFSLFSSFFIIGGGVGIQILPLSLLPVALGIGCLIFCLIVKIYQIEPVETLKWTWKKAIIHLTIGITFGTLILVIAKYINQIVLHFVNSNQFIIVFPGYESLGRGIVFGMSLGIIYGLVRGFQGDVIQQKTFPNQGIFQSAINAIIFAVIGFIFLGISASLLNWYWEGWVILGLSFGLVVGGGEACIKHLILRVILYFNGNIPWNYAHFLNEATRRVLMQKVGGGYIFIHRLLLEHLAQKN
ncbi:protein kinase domain-containing protein [Capilliphycus salinus ALCB114379]|uniref:protein kinase domain-containing protein n=1 Tax=Capilliphycus salinus TaxID=2768948 RepID=UPI0039A59E93